MACSKTPKEFALATCYSAIAMSPMSRVTGRLFDVVSIPVAIGDHIIGALAFGAEVGEAEAQEFSQIARSGIVFLVNGRVAASSLRQPELYPALADIFGEVLTGSAKLA